MQYKNLLTALVLGLSLTSEVAARGGAKGGFGQFGGKGANKGGAKGVAAASGTTAAATATSASKAGAAGAGAGGAAALQLNPSAVQTGSQQDGLQASGAKAGDAASSTDAANFINHCVGKTLTNGLQVKAGSCNGIVMGDIPASTKMVSTIITNPKPGDNLAANVDFNLTCNVQNIQAGSFTNADATYYSGPQQVNAQGQIIGHTHFTVQDMGKNLVPTTAMDAQTFAFFKGVDLATDAQGNLAITVAGGLPAGNYRVCTMASASNHQPVLMPVAQRGGQDDCTKFTVGGAGAGAGGSGAAGGSSTTAAAASSSTAAAAGGKGGNAKGGKGGKDANKGASKGGKASGQASGNNGVSGSNSNKGADAGNKGSYTGAAKASSSSGCASAKKNKNKVRSWQS